MDSSDAYPDGDPIVDQPQRSRGINNNTSTQYQY